VFLRLRLLNRAGSIFLIERSNCLNSSSKLEVIAASNLNYLVDLEWLEAIGAGKKVRR